MLNLLKSGGIFMVPILLCGVVTLYICIERIIFFVTTSREEARFLEKIPRIKKEDCAGESPCVRCAKKILDVAKKGVPLTKAEEALIQAEMDEASLLYEKNVAALASISSAAPLLGLLGTVTGNIKAFSILGGGTGLGNTALLASSIGEALITTVAGLCAAIPSLIFYHLFSAKVKKLCARLEKTANLIIFSLENDSLAKGTL